ncbi:transposase [Singulisphaera acidiphila]|uniref:transposase n=1 Tax=Singulisphaera acidiphila TaxID=466153 RepID=UPI00069332CE
MANHTRFFLSLIANILLEALRRLGLAGTAMAEAQCQTIRLKLLKIGASVRVAVRKVWVKVLERLPVCGSVPACVRPLVAVESLNPEV